MSPLVHGASDVWTRKRPGLAPTRAMSACSHEHPGGTADRQVDPPGRGRPRRKQLNRTTFRTFSVVDIEGGDWPPTLTRARRSAALRPVLLCDIVGVSLGNLGDGPGGLVLHCFTSSPVRPRSVSATPAMKQSMLSGGWRTGMFFGAIFLNSRSAWIRTGGLRNHPRGTLDVLRLSGRTDAPFEWRIVH